MSSVDKLVKENGWHWIRVGACVPMDNNIPIIRIYGVRSDKQFIQVDEAFDVSNIVSQSELLEFIGRLDTVLNNMVRKFDTYRNCNCSAGANAFVCQRHRQ